jgi:hypothetical protein
MKRIVASIGLVAVGASSIQAGALPGLTTESGKPWSVSATLRGFYDDNPSCLPNKMSTPGYTRSNTGFEVSPAVMFSFPWDQTSLSFGYVYSLKYYEHKLWQESKNYDQTHDFNLALTHAFSERYQLSVKDSFVIGQEPDILRYGNTFPTFRRVSGDNIRNYGEVNFLAQLTPEFGVEVGYANTYYDYADDDPLYDGTTFLWPSYSGLLDQLDHRVHIDGRYQILPQTIGILGYQFRQTEYIGDEVIGYDTSRGDAAIKSKMRNARSHYVYAGLLHNFRPDLSGSLQAGARYTDYYNNPANQNDWSPYVTASLQYTYLPESHVRLGATYDYSSTYTWSPVEAGDITLNGQTFDIFITLQHRITPKLFGNVSAEFANVTYYGGTYDNRNSQYYLVGLNLQYRFTPNFSAEVGYNYDLSESEYSGGMFGRSKSNYDRNRVYLGVTASY